jgi:hypothetical protein
VDEELLGKIIPGWNVGLDDKIRRLYARQPVLPAASSKDIDVVCRATVDQQSRLYPLRSAVIPRISSMAGSYRVLTPAQRLLRHAPGHWLGIEGGKSGALGIGVPTRWSSSPREVSSRGKFPS